MGAVDDDRDDGPSGLGGAGSLVGRLLVATPGVLEDENFRRTVVLLLEHSETGAVGVVLNRPSDTPVDQPFPGWDAVCADPTSLFVGGPVQQTMIIALGRPRDGTEPTSGFQEVIGATGGRIGTVDLRLDAWELGPSFESVRVFAGYAGWSAGQLENEIRLGAWIVTDAEPWDVFAERPDRLWSSVLRRQGGEVAYLANYPDDVSLN